MVDIILKWDGSDLGVIPENCVELVQEEPKIYTINMDEQGPVKCQIKTSKNNSLCCLLDEAKILFLSSQDTNLMMKYSLKPNGTHYGKYKGKKVVIYREIDNIVCSVNDVEWNHTLDIRSAVRRLLLYRELFGIKGTNKSTIVLKKLPEDPLIKFKGYNGCYPISIRESTVELPRNKTILPDTILNRWFAEGNLNVAILGFFGIDVAKFKQNPQSYDKEIELKRMKFSQNLDSLIGRIDPKLIWIDSAVNSYFRIKIRDLIEKRKNIDGTEILPQYVSASDALGPRSDGDSKNVSGTISIGKNKDIK